MHRRGRPLQNPNALESGTSGAPTAFRQQRRAARRGYIPNEVAEERVTEHRRCGTARSEPSVLMKYSESAPRSPFTTLHIDRAPAGSAGPE